VARAAHVFACVAVLLAAGGCRSGPAGEAAAGPRVVSLHDVTTELAVALGATGRLVGVSTPIDLPAEVRAAIAAVPRTETLEAILLQRPHTVLGLAVVAERNPDLVQALGRAGVRVQLGEPLDLAGVFAFSRVVAGELDRAAAGQQLVASLEGRARALTPPARRRRVFIYDCCDPPFTAGRNAVLTDLIRRAGGENVFADLAVDWGHVSWEEVVTRRPELVIVHDYRYEGQGDTDQKRQRLAGVPGLTGVPVAVLPLGYSLGGLRSVEAIERLKVALGLGS
jgi:iron complex transport system substrate-binding protein